MYSITRVATALHQRPAVLRVVVAGSDPLARAGLLSMLDTLSTLHVAGDFAVDDYLRSRIRVAAPDAIVVDGGAKAEEVAALARELEVPAVVLLTDLRDVVSLQRAGVRGLLMRTAAAAQIESALHAVAEGLTVFDEMIARTAAPSTRAEIELEEPLTHRELEVLQLLSGGLTNKEIAQRLGISDHTVKFHVNAILGKLSVETRTEAVVHAARLGIVVI
ncbi:MAG: LuxR C-terminal-related transcriptional regulator [Thermoanaerobaculia bacterium]